MKTILVSLIAGMFATTSFAADPTAAMDPKKQEMMKKWMEAATPGKNHEVLKQAIGEWTYTSKWWETKDSKPEESSGTSTNSLILGGRFLEQKVKGTAMGQPFEGIGTIGYDNVKGEYITTWLDNMSTGIVSGEGSYDKKSKTLKDKGEMSCPMSPEKEREYRAEFKFISNNKMSYTMFGKGEDGKEYKQMEMVYTRVK